MIQRPSLRDLSLFERHFQRLRVSISPKKESDTLSKSQGFDIKGALLDMSLSTMTEFLLGAEATLATTDYQAPRWTDEIAAELTVAFDWISKRERFKGFYWLVDGLEFRKACKNAKLLVEKLVCYAMERRKTEKSRTASTESYVAFESLLRQERDPEPIRDQFMSLVLAGRDSSGSLLCWMLYALAREPHLAHDLSTEIQSVVGTDKSRRPDNNELNSMIKLDQFVCESKCPEPHEPTDVRADSLPRAPAVLRLFPPVPLNGRFATKDTLLPRGGGEYGDAPILIPKGTLAAFSTFAAQRDRNLYGQDANEFRLERWDDDAIKQRRMVDWSYLPFLAGPRKCLGGKVIKTVSANVCPD